uniref:Uncharacterized protein MANES_03G128200 n=1 Tax=Rhizophora mucronata TaxID=61149 RepID=A0A2P2LSL8_RHIMU
MGTQSIQQTGILVH